MKRKRRGSLVVLCGLALFLTALCAGPASAQPTDINEIFVQKIADPANDTAFDFIITDASNNIVSLFTLTDPTSNSMPVIGLASGEYTVTEMVPPGWELTEIAVTPDDLGQFEIDLSNHQVRLNFREMQAPYLFETTFKNNLVPIPPTALLFASGLLGLWSIRKRIKA